jgi:hypothetical protein
VEGCNRNHRREGVVISTTECRIYCDLRRLGCLFESFRSGIYSGRKSVDPLLQLSLPLLYRFNESISEIVDLVYQQVGSFVCLS